MLALHGVRYHHLDHAGLCREATGVQVDGAGGVVERLHYVAETHLLEHLAEGQGVLRELAEGEPLGVVHVHDVLLLLDPVQLVQSLVLVVDGLDGLTELGEGRPGQLDPVEPYLEVVLVLEGGREAVGGRPAPVTGGALGQDGGDCTAAPAASCGTAPPAGCNTAQRSTGPSVLCSTGQSVLCCT